MRQIFGRLGHHPAPPWLMVLLVLGGLSWLVVTRVATLPASPSGPGVVVEIAADPAVLAVNPSRSTLPSVHHDMGAATAAADDGPRIAVLLTGLGLDPALARAALELPEAVAAAWSPYGDDPPLDQAAMRRHGHEIWLDLPVSRGDPLRFDVGPLALSPAKSDEQNLRRLRSALDRVVDLAGVVAAPGAFAASPYRLEPVARQLAELGLPLVLHGDFMHLVASADGVAAAMADGWMEVSTLASTIDTFLENHARQVRRDGTALLVVPAHPLVIDRLLRWLRKLSGEGLTLVPPSVLLRPPPDRQTPRVGALSDEGGRAKIRFGG